MRHVFNGVAGLIVILALLYIHTHPENADTGLHVGLYSLLGIWSVGFCLQFYRRTKLAGILVTIIPLLFLLFSFFFQIERGGLFHF